MANTGKGFEKPGPGELAAYEEVRNSLEEGLPWLPLPCRSLKPTSRG